MPRVRKHQQQITRHHRRQHHRQLYQGFDQELAEKSRRASSQATAMPNGSAARVATSATQRQPWIADPFGVAGESDQTRYIDCGRVRRPNEEAETVSFENYFEALECRRRYGAAPGLALTVAPTGYTISGCEFAGKMPTILTPGSTLASVS